MWKNITVIFFSVLISFSAFSQDLRWRTLVNSPIASNRFEDIYFATPNRGWVISIGGQIYSTTNGGNTWAVQFNIAGYQFRSIGFFDTLNGIAGLYTTHLGNILL